MDGIMSIDKLSPTERRLYDRLSDGQAHRKEELKLLLYRDNYGSTHNLAQHIYLLKKKLPAGLTISCDRYGKLIYYRLGRLPSSNEE